MGRLGWLGRPRQVLTARGATGWEIGSTQGVVSWIVSGRLRMEAGAFRAGEITPLVRSAWAAAALAVMVAVWVGARGYPGAVEGAPSLAAVATLLFSSSVLSQQYICWIVPWAAVATGEGDATIFWLSAAVSVLTVVPDWLVGHIGLFQVITLARDVLLLVIVLVVLDRAFTLRHALLAKVKGQTR